MTTALVRRRAIAPLALMALIYYLSDQPDLSTGLGSWDLVLRKLAHMTEYGLLALLWFRTLAPSSVRALPLAIAIAIVYAGTDELHQAFVDGRNGTPIDVGIDTVGVSLAALGVRYDGRVRSILMGGDGSR